MFEFGQTPDQDVLWESWTAGGKSCRRNSNRLRRKTSISQGQDKVWWIGHHSQDKEQTL